MTRKPIQFKRLDVRQRFRRTQARDVRDGRVSAQIEKHPASLEHPQATVFEAHFDDFRVDEAPLAKYQFGAASLVLVRR